MYATQIHTIRNHTPVQPGKIAVNGWVYMEARKIIPGIKQSIKIAHDQIKNHLAQLDYFPCQHTPSIWRYKTQPISFTLLVDNFGIKYSIKITHNT